MKPLLRIENYIPLIAQRAQMHWLRLPVTVRNWLDLQDFVQDGIVFARHELMAKYDRNRAAHFTTLLQISIDRFYKVKSMSLTTQRRSLWNGVPLEEGKVDVPEPKAYELDHAIAGEIGLARMYAEASPKLRKYMFTWFYSTDGVQKVVRSQRFRRARKEFLVLARQHSVDIDMCRAVLERKRHEGSKGSEVRKLS